MGLREERRVTQLDVAREAGVSQATVSYVLNDRAKELPSDTRRRVHDAMESLGYVPNAAAQNLRLSRTLTLATVIPDITNPFYPAFQRGVQDVAHTAGYDLILLDTDGAPEAEARATEWLGRGRIDGAAVVLMSMGFSSFEQAVGPHLPIVQLVPSREDAEALRGDTIYVDNSAAQQKIVEYLIESGHTRIAMIAGPEDSPTSIRRIHGYEAALRRAGLGVGPIERADFTEEAGRVAMRRLMSRKAPPTAVAAVNDLTAIGAMRAAGELGLTVPEDVAITGFDDIPEARVVTPALTTIDHSARDIGRTAGRMLLERLAEGEAPARQVVEAPTTLRIRRSVERV